MTENSKTYNFASWLLASSVFTLIFLVGCSNGEEELPCKPEKIENVFVHDMADVLNESQEKSLNGKLAKFKDETSNSIVLVTHPTFCGEEPFQYGVDIYNDMGVGLEDKDNGIVIVIKPKTDGIKGEAFITTGKGMEGAIPDAIAHRIINQHMIPSFKKGDYNAGINKGIETVTGLAKGEINQVLGTYQSNKKTDSTDVVFALLFLALFFGISFFASYKRVKKYAKLNDISFWSAWWILAENRRKHGRGYGDFTGSRGTFYGPGTFGGGGSRGSGYGGFGGGMSGGGGAGGSW